MNNCCPIRCKRNGKNSKFLWYNLISAKSQQNFKFLDYLQLKVLSFTKSHTFGQRKTS